MADAIFGDVTTIVSASYSGDAASSGIYSGAETTVAGVAPADTGLILSTGQVSDFTDSSGSTDTNTSDTNTSGDTTTDPSGTDGDSDFSAIAGAATYDTAFMEIEFIPDGEKLTLNFVLAS